MKTYFENRSKKRCYLRGRDVTVGEILMKIKEAINGVREYYDRATVEVVFSHDTEGALIDQIRINFKERGIGVDDNMRRELTREEFESRSRVEFKNEAEKEREELSAVDWEAVRKDRQRENHIPYGSWIKGGIDNSKMPAGTTPDSIKHEMQLGELADPLLPIGETLELTRAYINDIKKMVSLSKLKLFDVEVKEALPEQQECNHVSFESKAKALLKETQALLKAMSEIVERLN